jgi:PhnB protein
MAVKPIPDGYHTVTPYIIVKGARKALEFYQQAFGASVHICMDGPGESVAHAEFRIGDSQVMLGEENPAWGAVSPTTLGGTPTGICLYVADCDAMFNRAVAAGATVVKPLQDQFYGDRSGTVADPFGHKWTIATHIEDVAPEEMTRRMDEVMKQMAG